MDYDSLLWHFSDAMAHVAAAIEARFEREQVAWVFGLTGGELDDKPLKFRAPGYWGGTLEDREWGYHYDGPPEWAESDFDDLNENGVDYFTLVEIGCSYGSGAPERLFVGDQFYLRVAQYANSGETECPAGSCGDDETVGEDSTEGMHMCPLCEAEAGEKHGYIYVGDGCESVYKHIDVACAACDGTREDADNGTGLCYCGEEDEDDSDE